MTRAEVPPDVTSSLSVLDAPIAAPHRTSDPWLSRWGVVLGAVYASHDAGRARGSALSVGCALRPDRVQVRASRVRVRRVRRDALEVDQAMRARRAASGAPVGAQHYPQPPLRSGWVIPSIAAHPSNHHRRGASRARAGLLLVGPTYGPVRPVNAPPVTGRAVRSSCTATRETL